MRNQRDHRFSFILPRASVVKFSATLALLVCLAVFASAPLSAQPVTGADLPRMLSSGGKERRQAIWLIYQMKEHDLLRDAVQYLFESDDPEDHKAIINVMRAYGRGLENHLPDWSAILDRFMTDQVSEEVLLDCVKLSGDWQEHSMMHALGRLSTHPRARVRMAAFQTMSSMGDDNLIPVLLRLVTNPRPVYRLYGLEGLQKFADNRLQTFMQKTLIDTSKSARIYALSSLAEQPGTEDFHVVQNYPKEDDVEVRERMLDLIGLKGWRRQNYLLHRALSDPQPLLRRAALRSIERLNDTVASSLVSRQLEEESVPEIRLASIETLLTLGTGGGGSGLAKVILSDPDEKLRLRAAVAAGFLKEKGAGPALVKALESDPSAKVRLEAAGALGEIRDTRFLPGLLASVGSRSEIYEVKSASLIAIQEMASLEAVPGLVSLLDNSTDAALLSQIRSVLNRLRPDKKGR